jgi:hypothetical protein
VVSKPFGDRLPEGCLVIDDEQMFLIFSHLAARTVF